MKAKLLKLISVMSFLITIQAFAQDGHEHEGWPENTLLALEGQDAVTQDECLLFVTDLGFTGPEQTPDQFFAVIQTNYAHGDAQAAPFTVKIVTNRPGVLSGVGANGQDQIALFLDPQSLDLRNVKSFNLKWLHGNHFHTNRCVNMTVHDHDDEHEEDEE
jgi:hypothetical protein